MAKTSGLGDNLYINGFDLSGDIGSLSRIGGGTAVIDVTGIDKSAMERLGGERDGAIVFTAFFNTAAGQAHQVLASLPTSDVAVQYCRGTTLGNAAACMTAKQIGYDPTRAAGGALTIAVNAQANGYGLEWGTQLTAGKRSDTTATSPATGVDLTTVSTAFGWQAYLQVFSFAGTSVTVTLQDSSDNATFGAFGGGGGAFGAATGITTQRMVSPGATDTVQRYVRAITTGTFTQATFAVVFVRNQTAVVF